MCRGPRTRVALPDSGAEGGEGSEEEAVADGCEAAHGEEHADPGG